MQMGSHLRMYRQPKHKPQHRPSTDLQDSYLLAVERRVLEPIGRTITVDNEVAVERWLFAYPKRLRRQTCRLLASLFICSLWLVRNKRRFPALRKLKRPRSSNDGRSCEDRRR